MPRPLGLAFLGCGFITAVHSRHLRALDGAFLASYASRDRARADGYRRRFGGTRSYGSYSAAIEDREIDAVVVAVPPVLHKALTLEALGAGKHVLVEKPAFTTLSDYVEVEAAAAKAGLTVMVGENDHYKPLAVSLRRLLADGVVGEMLFAHFTTLARRLKPADDWRNDEAMAGGDAFFEEGIHWLHLAGSLGPAITSAHGFRPPAATVGPDRRAKSLMVAFTYDNGAVGTLYYSREVPSLLRGARLSKIFGRDGIITFESNGAFVLARGRGWPKLLVPGLRDIRGYQAMYRDFAAAIRSGRRAEMHLGRAIEDQRLMDAIYASLAPGAEAVPDGPGADG